MATQTSIAAQQDIEELYNTLMWGIEPELTTWIWGDLEYLYADETAEQRTARYAWYAAAFEIFVAQYAQFMSACEAQLLRIKKAIQQAGQVESDQSDAMRVDALETSLDLS